MSLIDATTWALRKQATLDFAAADMSAGTGVPKLEMQRWGARIGLAAESLARVPAAEIENGLEFTLAAGTTLKLHREPTLHFPNAEVWQPEHGLLQVDLILTAKPATNRFPFRLTLPAGAVLYHQPALTEEEIDDGCQRPEWCVNSYACFVAHGRKLGHLPRPFAVDADGAWTWGTYDWNPLTGILAKTIPQPWLNGALYPVRIDATFGYTSIGGSDQSLAVNFVFAFGPHACPEAGTLTAVSCYCLAAVGTDATFGCYDDSANPNNLVGDSAGGALAAAWGWQEQAVSGSLAAANYWFALNHDTNTASTKYDSIAGFKIPYKSSAYVSGTLPDPYGTPTGTSVDRKASIYGTYTPSGGGGAIMNQLQGANLGADLFDGTLIAL